MGHSIEIKSKVKKYLMSLPRETKCRIAETIEALKDTPRPVGCEKLKAYDAYRIRVGDYRVIYEVHDDILVVLVVKVGHRSSVYRD